MFATLMPDDGAGGFTHGPAPHATGPRLRAQLADRRCRDDFFHDRARRAHAAHRVGPVDGRMAAGDGLAAAAVGRSLAGGAAEISFLAAGKIDQSWFQRRRIQADLLAGVSPSPVGPADRRGLRPAARLVLAARPAFAGAEAAPVGAAGAGRPAGRAGLGDGGVRPDRPALGQPLPPGRPSAAGGGALRLHGLADPGARAAGRAARRCPRPAARRPG